MQPYYGFPEPENAARHHPLDSLTVGEFAAEVVRLAGFVSGNVNRHPSVQWIRGLHAWCRGIVNPVYNSDLATGPLDAICLSNQASGVFGVQDVEEHGIAH